MNLRRTAPYEFYRGSPAAYGTKNVISETRHANSIRIVQCHNLPSGSSSEVGASQLVGRQWLTETHRSCSMLIQTSLGLRSWCIFTR